MATTPGPRTDVELGELRVRRVTPAEQDACFAIRKTVFIEEQSVPFEEELDGLDEESTHFLAEWRTDTSGYVDDGWTPVGTARLRTVPGSDDQPVAKAERVAVLAEWRGRGVGAALMTELEAEARRWGHPRIKLASQESAIPFYDKLGYRAYGERFMDAGIPHFWMDKVFVDCPT